MMHETVMMHVEWTEQKVWVLCGGHTLPNPLAADLCWSDNHANATPIIPIIIIITTTSVTIMFVQNESN